MKYTNHILFTLFLLITHASLGVEPEIKNGQIIDREEVDYKSDPILMKKLFNNEVLKDKYKYIDEVKVEKITYMSDGLKVKGYIAMPKKKGKYPSIIWNRGGNREFGKITPMLSTLIAMQASWGYVVVASQYRGNDGGEGKEQFGGEEINDVLNLIPLLETIERSDTNRLGIYGWSRGSMMTFLALAKSSRFKAAVVGGISCNCMMKLNYRPTFEKDVYAQLIPDYYKNKKSELDKRDALKFSDKICRTTPILMMHGSADWRTMPENALNLSMEFIKHKVPHRLVIFEGANHIVLENIEEREKMTKKWFDDFLKNDRPLPNLEPHGK